MTTGLDTNILCYALDPAFPEHKKLKKLLTELSPENTIAINPTTLHETYHTLVYGQKWTHNEAAKRLKMLLQHPHIEFYNQTKKISIIALNLSAKHALGGRDALITANFLANKVPTILTHDQELLTQQKISWKNSHITFKDPLNNTKNQG
jgi:predicted nucleic acid-binding protein